MFARLTALLLFVATFITLSSAQLPAEHPIALALKFQKEISLSNDQVGKLRSLDQAASREFNSFRESMEGLKRQAEELERNGSRDEAAFRALQSKAEQLQANARATMDQFTAEAMQVLTQEQRERLAKFAPNGQKRDDFLLGIIMEKREALDITPQQFTKLQFLQADFIRAFAPLREAMEMTQLEAKMKGPSEELKSRGELIARQIKELQAKISEQAVSAVLTLEQRAKVQDLLRSRGG